MNTTGSSPGNRSGAGAGHGGDAGRLPTGCTPVAACVDYRAYVFDLPTRVRSRPWAEAVQALSALGDVRPPAMGVICVHARWGFLVVPPPGFPQLKVNFFHHTPEVDARRVLSDISHALSGLVA